jgi:glycosyltransferase involved in cell wall biosynthesis
LPKKPITAIGGACNALSGNGLPEIAVIVPIYNGRPMLEELCRRLLASLGSITSNFVILLIDDAAPDDPWPLICELGRSDRRIKGVRLSRNFGQHYALTAGIDVARARWYVIMDCDLQDAPEDIPLLYAKVIEGHDLVAGMRRKEGHSMIKRLSSRLFYGLFRVLSGIQLDWSVGNFRIFSDRVADGLRSMREQMRFLPASFEWMGFNPVYVDLPHHERGRGHSSYTFGKLFKLATHTILAHSQTPLKIVAGFGFVMSLITFAIAFVFFSRALVFGTEVIGWSSLFVTMLFIGSVQIALMGILGIYIGKTFEETKGRPLYFVRDTMNLAMATSAVNLEIDTSR